MRGRVTILLETFDLTPGLIGDISALLAAIFWSFSVIWMRIAGFRIQAIPLNIFKNFIAVLGFGLVVLLSGSPLLLSLTETEWALLVLSAVLGIAIADVLFLAALNRLGASLQAIVDCIYAPSVIVTAFFLFQETITVMEFFGGSLIGAAVVFGAKHTPEVKNKKDLYVGLSMGIASHILMAIGALIIRDIYREESVAWICGFRFFVANLLLLVWVRIRKQSQSPFIAFKLRETWKYTVPSGVLGAFLATYFWLSGFKFQVAGRAAIYNQMASVFIAILAILILREKITPRKALGIALGITGALIVSL